VGARVRRGLIVDLFAGGGGASTGIEAALGRSVDIAINHDALALAVHKANHPETRHLEADIWEVRPAEATGGRPVDLLWASPDCTHFSVAKGDVPRRQDIRSLAWAVVRWAAAVRPAVIILENVSEFRTWGPLGADGRPVKRRMGVTFLRWKGKLEKLGYRVDFRILDAAEYGAPTRRRRLFIVARGDGNPIRWPERTHGPGLLPVHTAAECIDWSLPCPSIFERKKPLAEKTLWRIAQGIRRFVLENPQPFIVQMSHGQWAKDGTPRRGRPTRDLAETLGTVTGSNDYGLVTPSLMLFRHDSEGAAIDGPTPTITAGGQPRPKRPATGNPIGLLAPSLIKVNHGKRDARGESIEEPVTTVTATQRGHALVASTLIQTGYGEREGQAARVPGLDKPVGTLVAGGQKHALVSAFLARHFGGVVGAGLDGPLHTITSRDHHSLVTASLEEQRGNDGDGSGVSVDRVRGDRGARGRHGVEAAELEGDLGASPEAGGPQDGQRLLRGVRLEGQPPVRRPGSPARLDGDSRTDPAADGDQPQGREPGEQQAGEPGAGDFQREQPPFVSDAGTEGAEVVAGSDPRAGGAAREGAPRRGPDVRGDRPAPGDSADDGLPGHPPPVADHTRAVRAFLTTYYSSDGTKGKGQRLDEPARTITAKARLGLVTVEGTEYQIVDIGMRMLEPHELLRAQFGRFADAYDLSAATTKAGKVRLIGNSVCPEVAEAVVASNLTGERREAVA
jgi:DNA (cytosine-5)-methyltransferase 1